MARVLIVDDDPSTRSILAGALARPGREIEVAEDGFEALRLIEARLPDVIVTDVVMPRMSGWTLVKQLRAAPATAFVPVIFLSGLDAPEDRIQGFRLGGDDFVAKPVNLEELRLRIESALRHAPRERARAVGMSGTLAAVGISTLLMVLSMERKTGALSVTHQGTTARLLIRGGDVVQAWLEDVGRGGVECVYELFSWTDGEFEFVSTEIEVPDSIGCSTTGLLLEAARRSDEGSRGLTFR